MAINPLNSDLIELLSNLVAGRASFLVVGGHAVAKYGEPRYTKDVDLWIDNSKANSVKVYTILKNFGAPLNSINPEFFTFDDHFLKLGKEPFRVDIICGMRGLKFSTAWKRRVSGELFGVKVPFVGIKELIKLKKIAGRPQDKLDITSLNSHLKLAKKQR